MKFITMVIELYYNAYQLQGVRSNNSLVINDYMEILKSWQKLYISENEAINHA